MMKKSRILILSEGFGTGHTQAAQALAVGLNRLSPDVRARAMELGTFLNPVVAPIIYAAYRKTVSVQPRLVGLLYRKQYQRPLNRITQLALHRIFYTQAAKVVSQLRPDAIVCTHPFPNIIISRLKRSGLDIPLFTLITDYDAHGSWIDDEVSTFLVSAQVVKDKLLQRGIASDRIVVSGIPVHPNFWESFSQAEARDKLGLQALPTVMFMGGGWGLSIHDIQLEELTRKWRDQVQFLFCMGSNHKMIARMKQCEAFQHPNVHIYEFTRDIPVMMDAADLLVTKPGGMTCTEGMLKGIPMLFDAPIPGQEEENCRYFIERGYAQMMDNRDTLEHWLDKIVHRTSSSSNSTATRPAAREELERCPRELIALIQDIAPQANKN